LPDADDDSGDGVPAVVFKVEFALEGVVDRLDDLSQGFEESGTGSLGFALAGRAQQAQGKRLPLMLSERRAARIGSRRAQLRS
jgi:hypothetical protein